MKKSIFFFALLFLAISSYQLHAESDTLWTTQIGSTVPTVKFSPDGDYVYAAAEGRGPLKLDAKTGDIIMEYEGVNYTSFDFGHALDISPDGKTLVGGDIDNLYFFDTETGELKDSIISPTKGTFYNRFSDVKFTYDNKYLIACVDYGDTYVNTPSYVIILDLETKQIIRRFNGRETLKLAIDQQNKTLAYIEKNQGDDDYNINLLEIGTWKNVGVLKGHTSRITDLSFSPDGSRLASSDFDTYLVKIWDIEKKELLLSFKPSGTYTFSIELFDNDKLVYSGGEFIDLRLRTTKLSTKLEVNNILQKAADFKILNSKIVVAYNDIVSLLNSDRLTSVSSDFTKDLIYPNPATNLLTVPKTFFGDSFVAMSITDLTGKVVYTFDNNQQIYDLIIDISAYNTGSYYLNFNYKSRSQSSRFIKE